MSFGHFPADYGQGTGLAAGHTALGAELNQMFANGHPSVRLARKMVEGQAIYVNAETGDDHPANDGAITPLKTLDALADRMPVAGSGEHNALGYNPEIHIAAGDYLLTKSLDLELPDLAQINGEFVTEQSFELDSVQNDYEIHKDPLTPAWAVNEHAEKFLQWGFDLGGGLVYYYTYPIIKNGEHYLFLGISPGFDPSVLPIGSLVNIVEPGVRVNCNNKRLSMAGKDAFIAGLDVSNSLWLSTSFEGLYLNGCRLSNMTYGLESSGNSRKMNIQGCIFRDMSSSGTFLTRASFSMRACMFARCPTGVRVSWGSRFEQQAQLFFVDCTRGISAGEDSDVGIYYSGGIYCDNTPTWLLASKNCKLAVNKVLSVTDGKVPATLISAKNGCDVLLLAGQTIEASSNTLDINGVTSTMANFLGAGYSGWWTDQNGNRVYVQT